MAQVADALTFFHRLFVKCMTAVPHKFGRAFPLAILRISGLGLSSVPAAGVFPLQGLFHPDRMSISSRDGSLKGD